VLCGTPMVFSITFSIAAAAATTAHIHLPAEAAAVYIPLSAPAAAHSPRSAALKLFSEDTTVRKRT
jgi:TRAP-type C4-dicarboxylate transport system substrate-binding protein